MDSFNIATIIIDNPRTPQAVREEVRGLISRVCQMRSETLELKDFIKSVANTDFSLWTKRESALSMLQSQRDAVEKSTRLYHEMGLLNMDIFRYAERYL